MATGRPKTTCEITDEDLVPLLIWAVRFNLGRSDYGPKLTKELLERYKDSLFSVQKLALVDEIKRWMDSATDGKGKIGPEWDIWKSVIALLDNSYAAK